MSDLQSELDKIVSDQNEVSEQFLVVDKQKKPVIAQKRKRGRPRKQKPVETQSHLGFDPAQENIAADQAQEAAEAQKILLQRANAAKGAALMVQTSGMIIAGDDGRMQPDEFSNVEENFNRYFEAKQIDDFPPGISLGLALGGYYVRILTIDKTRPKVARVFDWFLSKFSFLKRKQKNVAQPDSRDDAKRQEYAGENADQVI